MQIPKKPWCHNQNPSICSRFTLIPCHYPVEGIESKDLSWAVGGWTNTMIGRFSLQLVCNRLFSNRSSNLVSQHEYYRWATALSYYIYEQPRINQGCTSASHSRAFTALTYTRHGRWWKPWVDPENSIRGSLILVINIFYRANWTLRSNWTNWNKLQLKLDPRVKVLREGVHFSISKET